MDESTAREVWAQYVSGPRPAETQCRELLNVLRGNEPLRREFLNDAQMDGALPGMAPEDEESFVQSVFDFLRAQKDDARFLRAVETRLGRRKRFTRLAAAAAILAGLASLPFVRSTTPRAPEDPEPPTAAVPKSPVDDVTLLPIQGRIVGDDWQRIRDEEASSGLALQSATQEAKKALALPASYVHFSFFADGDKEYAIRVQARGRVDSAIVLEPVDAALVSPCFTYGPAGSRAFTFDGSGLPASYASVEEGYWWVGRNGKGPLDRIPDLTRAVVRFTQTGFQTLRLYVQGGPVRVEAIHLSTPYRAGL